MVRCTVQCTSCVHTFTSNGIVHVNHVDCWHCNGRALKNFESEAYCCVVIRGGGGILAVIYWSTNGMGAYALDIIHHLALPVIALVTLKFAGDMLVMRDTMLEVIKEDYITTARAKGLPDKVIRDKHAARTALLPLMTSFVIGLASTVSGGVITETMFSWKGMGLTLLEATTAQDTPLAIGCLVFTGVLVLLAHLVADILYAFLDPRIRY